MSGPSCDSEEIGLKGFFLGPQAENGAWLGRELQLIFRRWFEWRAALYPQDGCAISEADRADPVFIERQRHFTRMIVELLRRYEGEVPKFSPRYIGHMFSEISLPALLGHIVTMLHNPNNISGESSRVGVELEDEAIGALARMIRMDPKSARGHFTSGGTLANFEALLRARERIAHGLAVGACARSGGKFSDSLFESAHLGWSEAEKIGEGQGDSARPWHWLSNNPFQAGAKIGRAFGTDFQGPVLLVPENKHYSWEKGVSLLGLGEESFWSVELDRRGKLSRAHLRQRIEQARREGRPILMVVSVAGTTELGGIDPIHEIQDELDQWRQQEGIHLWHHVDAAYGGFFCCLLPDKEATLPGGAAEALSAISRVNSVTLDPHKLGYVPYSCGAFIASNERDYLAKSFDAPYVNFDLNKDRGPYTLEGSRSAAGAAATWMTESCIGLNREGFGRIIARTIRIRKQLEQTLRDSELGVRIAPCAETNILCFTLADPGEALSSSNERSRKIYDALSPARNGRFFVSKTALRWSSYGAYLDGFVGEWGPVRDTDEVVLVRLCLMNPFFDSKEMNSNFFDEFLATISRLCGRGSP